LFTQIPVIALPCNAEYCTGQHTVDRSLVSLSRYRQKRERSWRPCLSACPFGQDREFPRHSTYSVVKDHGGLFLSPHFYWQGKRHFLNQNEKIFLFSFAGGLCLSLLLAKNRRFYNQNRKINFIILRFAVSCVPAYWGYFCVTVFFQPRLEYISILYSGGVPSTSQHLCCNFFCDNEDHMRSDGHQMFQPERPQPAHRQAVPCTEVSLFTQPLSWLAARCC